MSVLNLEVRARLFMGPRTVHRHLRKVFGKLSISSRTQLADAFPGRTAICADASLTGCG